MENRPNLSKSTKQLVWFKAHGRCAMCNAALYMDEKTMIKGNMGQYAHIIAAKPDGPRGDNELSSKLADDPDNIILLCPTHHKIIDDNPNKFTVEYLHWVKNNHENRIERLVSIPPSNNSLVVCYNPNVGKQRHEISCDAMYETIFPDRFPVSEPIRLESQESMTDNKHVYWEVEPMLLQESFNQKLKDKLKTASHITVFALGPQPLLIKLGSLLGDIHTIDVMEKHREPNSWKWLEEPSDNELSVEPPSDKSKDPILILALSGKEIIERVKEQFGSNYSYWILTCKNAHRGMMRTKDQLSNFRQTIRALIGEINTFSKTPIKIFTAVPNSCAIELGRIRLPKSDNSWVLYDKPEDSPLYLETITI